MSFIELLAALITKIPDLMDLFLSGFVCMMLYSWLSGHKCNVNIIIVWSLIISYLIKAFYSTIHLVVLCNVLCPRPVKILVYAITGVILPCIVMRLKRSTLLRRILQNLCYKSVNDDIFNDIIDYKKATFAKVYIKNSDTYYIGIMCAREENGLNSWIVLKRYCAFSKANTDFCQSFEEKRSIVTINLSNVENIELYYEPDSIIWKQINNGI